MIKVALENIKLLRLIYIYIYRNRERKRERYFEIYLKIFKELAILKEEIKKEREMARLEIENKNKKL